MPMEHWLGCLQKCQWHKSQRFEEEVGIMRKCWRRRRGLWEMLWLLEHLAVLKIYKEIMIAYFFVGTLNLRKSPKKVGPSGALKLSLWWQVTNIILPCCHNMNSMIAFDLTVLSWLGMVRLSLITVIYELKKWVADCWVGRGTEWLQLMTALIGAKRL